MTLLMIVVVSPGSASCRVTATRAPVSRSTACSALWARCVAIFHLRDLRIGIPWIFPILVRGFLLALAVQARQLFARRRRDPRRLREASQEFLIALPGVAAHNAAHCRVRFEHGGVNRAGFAPEQSRRHQPLLHPREDGTVALEVDDAPRPRNRRMIRRWLVHP